MISSIYADNPGSDIRKSVQQFSAHVDKLLDALESESLDGDADVAKQQVKKKAVGVFARLFNQEIQMSKSSATATPPAAEETRQPVNLAELPEPIRKMIEDGQAAIAQVSVLSKSVEDLTATVKTTSDALATETAKREAIEFEAIAKREIPYLPGTDAERGAQLLSMKKALSEEQYNATLTAMKAASDAIKSQTVATGLDNAAPAAGTATAEFETRAKAMMVADPKLNKSQALAKCYEADAELYQKLVAEEKAAGQRQTATA